MLLKVTAVVMVVLVVGSEAGGFRRKIPSFPQSPYHRDRAPATPKGPQNPQKIIDTFIQAMPEITTVIKNVTKGASEKQLANLKKATYYLLPAMHLFFEVNAGRSLTWEERSMLDQIGGMTKLLTNALTKSKAQAGSPLPDYTDLIEDIAATDAEADFTLAGDESQSDSLFTKNVETSNPPTAKNEEGNQRLPVFAASAGILKASGTSNPPTGENEPNQHLPVSSLFTRTPSLRLFNTGVQKSDVQTETREERLGKTIPIPHSDIPNPSRSLTEYEQTDAQQRTLLLFRSPSVTEDVQAKEIEQRTQFPGKQTTHFHINQHSATFPEAMQTKEADKRTQFPRKQTNTVTFKPSTTTRRRYTPSQLLRQQLFGKTLPTTSPTPALTTDIRFPRLPVVRPGTGRRTFLRRRRLITTRH